MNWQEEILIAGYLRNNRPCLVICDDSYGNNFHDYYLFSTEMTELSKNDKGMSAIRETVNELTGQEIVRRNICDMASM
jgi:hypothetical protein